MTVVGSLWAGIGLPAEPPARAWTGCAALASIVSVAAGRDARAGGMYRLSAVVLTCVAAVYAPGSGQGAIATKLAGPRWARVGGGVLR